MACANLEAFFGLLITIMAITFGYEVSSVVDVLKCTVAMKATNAVLCLSVLYFGRNLFDTT